MVDSDVTPVDVSDSTKKKKPDLEKTKAELRAAYQEYKSVPEVSVNELRTSFASFSSILPPVFWTMVLSAFIVLYVTPQAGDIFAQSPLVVLDEGEAQNAGEATKIGLTNALIIVGVIGAMTFLI